MAFSYLITCPILLVSKSSSKTLSHWKTIPNQSRDSVKSELWKKDEVKHQKKKVFNVSDRCMRKRPFINIHLDMWLSLLDVILARPVVQYSNTLHNTLPATSCHTRWPLSNLFAQILVFNTRYFHPHILKISPLTPNAQCYNIFYWRMVPLKQFYK